jgi:hypothetical protein
MCVSFFTYYKRFAGKEKIGCFAFYTDEINKRNGSGYIIKFFFFFFLVLSLLSFFSLRLLQFLNPDWERIHSVL